MCKREPSVINPNVSAAFKNPNFSKRVVIEILFNCLSIIKYVYLQSNGKFRRIQSPMFDKSLVIPFPENKEVFN